MITKLGQSTLLFCLIALTGCIPVYDEFYSPRSTTQAQLVSVEQPVYGGPYEYLYAHYPNGVSVLAYASDVTNQWGGVKGNFSVAIEIEVAASQGHSLESVNNDASYSLQDGVYHSIVVTQSPYSEARGWDVHRDSSFVLKTLSDSDPSHNDVLTPGIYLGTFKITGPGSLPKVIHYKMPKLEIDGQVFDIDLEFTLSHSLDAEYIT